MCALLKEGTPKIWLSMEYIRVRLWNRGNDNSFKCCVRILWQPVLGALTYYSPSYVS